MGTERRSRANYDLLVKDGHMVDPSQKISAQKDVAISDHRIAHISANIPVTDTRQILDARDQIVTPRLIDVHVHVYDGVAPLSIPADPNCIAKGVTTVIDAGSPGARTFPDFVNASPAWSIHVCMSC